MIEQWFSTRVITLPVPRDIWKCLDTFLIVTVGENLPLPGLKARDVAKHRIMHSESEVSLAQQKIDPTRQ